MFKRLQDGVCLGPGLLKKTYWNLFGGQFFIIEKTFGHEMVYSKYCSFKKNDFLSSYLENAMENAMG